MRESSAHQVKFIATDGSAPCRWVRILRSKEEEIMSDELFLEWISKNCKVVYFPNDSTYPIEHDALARKDMWEHLRNVAKAHFRSELLAREVGASNAANES